MSKGNLNNENCTGKNCCGVSFKITFEHDDDSKTEGISVDAITDQGISQTLFCTVMNKKKLDNIQSDVTSLLKITAF